MTVASNDLKQAESLINGVKNGRAIPFNVQDNKALHDAVASNDLVISLVPAALHPRVAQACVATKKSMVTASYTPPAITALHEQALKADISILNECGLDPGIDHMEAMRIIHDIQAKGGVVCQLYS